MENITTDPETGLITTQDMTKVRELDFVRRFSGTILKKLIEALGVTRKIPMIDGTTMYMYTTTGTLQDGVVAEGAVIPLSEYERVKTPVGAISLKKWRKAASAESILKSGYREAVLETDAKLLADVQSGIRTDFFDYLKDIDATVVGADTLQKVLANTWGQLQLLFENDAVEVVHFINPLTIADYLGTASITIQQAFGFNYIVDFLGLGTVVMTSQVPRGTVISTAKENLVMYYVPVTSEAMTSLGMTADPTGYIAIKSGYPSEKRAQVETLILSGIQFLVEYADGVVIGQIDATPTLGSITVTSAEGATSGKSTITLAGYTPGTGETYVYKTHATTAPAVTYGQKLGATWTPIASGDSITATDGHKITVASIDASGRAQAAGNTTLDVKA